MSENYLNLGGTIRSSLATETLQRIEPLLKTLGITRVADVTGLDTINIPTAVCIRPNSKHLSVSQGKGLTIELAKVSAIMESIESYHAENPAPPDLVGSYAELVKNYPVINPTEFSPGFLDCTNLPQKSIPWIRAKELLHKEEVYIPHALICLDSTLPHPEYSYLQISSNGLASGNSINEATCHALFEIIERDSITKWLTKTALEQHKTKIDLNTIDAKVIKNLLGHFAAANVRVHVWDVTADIGIPAYRCVVENRDILRRLGIFYGFGAHLSKEIALARALTEAAQTRLTLISGSRDDVFPAFYEKNALSALHIPKLEEGKTDYNARPQETVAHSFAENLATTLNSLQQIGCTKVIVLDHTKPKLKLPVVHAFVPGLHFIGSRHGAL